MSAQSRSIDSVYEEIASLTGNRTELERQRFILVRAIRALRVVIYDKATIAGFVEPDITFLETAVVKLENQKTALWLVIEQTDCGIQRLTDLVQNGTFDHE